RAAACEVDVERAMSALFREPHRDRRIGCNEPRHLETTFFQIGCRVNVIRETDAERFFRADLAAGRQKLECHAATDCARKALRAAEARRNAELHLRLTEHGFVRREDPVAGEGELASAA